MLFHKTLISAVAALAIASASVSASPVAHPASLSNLDKRAFGGYNDWNCKPSSSYPYPIVMIHGLGGNSVEWVYMATRFAAKGYCAFTLDYGHLEEVPFLNGLDDLRISANQLSEFVDKGIALTKRSSLLLLFVGVMNKNSEQTIFFLSLEKNEKVLTATGASKVDILGHSEGSTLPRVYFKYNNGGAKTSKILG